MLKKISTFEKMINMNTISGEEFENIIYSDEVDLLSDYLVEIKNRVNIDLEKVNLTLTFSNITFSGGTIRFYKKKSDCTHSINIKKCTFLSDVHFDFCNVQAINFTSNIFNCNNLKINNSKILDFRFKDDNVFEKGVFKIDTCEFSSFFDIEKIKFVEFSKFNLLNSSFISSVSIVNCEINQLLVSHCNFKNHFDYFGNKVNSNNSSAFFNNCEFNYSSFFETRFNNDTHFADCKFLNLSKFENTGNEIYSTVRFDDCEFIKQVSFNKSRIHKILFNNLKFYDIVSLQETYFDIVDIDRTIFEKQANFDDIQIKQIYNCNRRTIRAIKLQLQKAENKIDYNKFRVYEFNAYRADINKTLKEFKNDKNGLNHRKRESIQLMRDLWILRISDLASEYGTDWIRAFKFTIIFGFLFYSVFFVSENHKEFININNWEEFGKGYIRFFLVTDFYNPLEKDRIFIESFWTWIPFILGKIVITFGIYEMIQSFRKFKV